MSEPTAAAHALELYRWAVQDPLTQVRVLDRIHRTRHGGPAPTRLREDFAGNGADAAAWVALSPHHEAVAVDLDAAALEWGAARARRLLGADAAARFQTRAADVFAVSPPATAPAHVLSALNFSLFYFHSRDRLRAYLAHARRCLDPQRGLFVGNAFGGATTLGEHRDVQIIDGRTGHAGEAPPPAFEYEWTQDGYDALSARARCRIHFRGLPGGGEIRDAFVYDWRLWTLPELVEVAAEAGFANVEVWRHTYDPAKGAAGVFLGPVTQVDGLETWVAYLVASG